MDIIHLLPDSVANQIAAGEVVQRPASVIKELLENSIDAGATQIQIVLREAGKELIQVIDNGKGMSPTDARMAFERHATSKIQQATDLFALHTMGFRGEALASIVAVAEVDMRTRRADDEAGVLIRLAGSKLLTHEPVTCAAGTNIEVRNLFFNIPARRKFLKRNETELSNVIVELQHVALANPQVGITLVHNDKQLYQYSSGSYKQRILQIFGKSLGQQLIPISVDSKLLNIEGFVCQPEGARKKSALQYFFVNDRYMNHPYFKKAVTDCYQDIIPDGTQPNFFIYLKVDPSTIDVNIHPTKTEIKFEEESARWHILMAGVREALGKYNGTTSIDFDQADAPEFMPYDPTAPKPAEPKVDYRSDYNPFRKPELMSNWNVAEDFMNEPSGETPASTPISGNTTLKSRLFDSQEGGGNDALLRSHLQPHLRSRITFDNEETPMPVQQSEQPEPVHDDTSIMAQKGTTVRRYLQIGNAYIAARSKQGLILIDQHQAHVSILFDRYFQQIQQRQGVSQQELFPETVSISPADQPILESILPQLQFLGFDIVNLGSGCFAVNGKPASLDKNINLQDLIDEMIEVAKEETRKLSTDLDRRLALKLSRKQAIKAGQMLSEEEMSQLVDALYSLNDHTYTPDGKNIAVHLTVDEIASKF